MFSEWAKTQRGETGETRSKGPADTWDAEKNHEESTSIDHERIIHTRDPELHWRLTWRAGRQTG